MRYGDEQLVVEEVATDLPPVWWTDRAVKSPRI